MALPYPGVTITEVDNSAVVTRSSTGVPAGVIGTAAKGPAYVPLNFNSFSSYSAVYGVTGNRFGPIAVNLWLNGSLNSNATYLRVLGIGDGLKRESATGAVNYAGFTVGEQQVGSSGVVSANPYANAGGLLGRTYFLGCYMSESAGSTVFSSAGIQTSATAVPIIRGVIMTPSGVSLTLSGNSNPSNTPTTLSTSGRPVSGSFDTRDGTFVMLLDGHINTVQYPNVITASLSTTNLLSSYISNVLNKDPAKFQQAGHMLYTWYDVADITAAITGSGILTFPTASGNANKQDTVFITSSSIGRNTSNATTPNFEQFKERFTHPVSPFVLSQKYGGTSYNLFRVHSISDGLASLPNKTPDLANNYSIRISNITPANQYNEYATFNLDVISIKDGTTLKSFAGLTLDPNSSNYVAAVIGNQNIYFDFDRANGSQKIVVDGDYPVNNDFIRIELSEDLINGNVPADAIPAGFRGIGYIFTSGSSLATFGSSTGQIVSGQEAILRSATTPPVPFAQTITNGTAPTATVTTGLNWGAKFTRQSLPDTNSDSALNDSIASYLRFFPSYDITGKKFYNDNSSAADSFGNDLFTIENIQVVTGAKGDPPSDVEAILWTSASYIRQGNITSNGANKTRALLVSDLNDLHSSNRSNVAFTFFLQGGFDGTNLFDTEKSNLTDLAAMREISDATNQGGMSGPTVSSYKKAIDIMGSTADVNIQLLAMPGIRVPQLTNYALSAVENRFDALYLMDIQQKNSLNSYITSSAEVPVISNTVTDFMSRGMNSSFGAAYFPDVTIQSPDGTGLVTIPPSAAVLAAYAKNDLYAPWYAPAGVTRGAIAADSTAVDLNEASEALGTIYNADINPIIKLSAGPTVVWGQKTLLKTASSLDRVNVRRLLIDVRRRVRAVANSLLFEPNTQATLARFNSLVNPIMQDVQNRSGVVRYKVVIDTSTTTQADIDNNTIRGKIFLQPVRTAEFISIDFVVNASSAL